MMGTTRTPLLPRAAYWDADYARHEQQELFGRSWLFAGLAAEFSQGTQELTLGGIEVTLSVMGGAVTGRTVFGDAEAARCGGLLFLKLRPDAIDLETALAPYFETIAAATASITAADHVERLEIAANWKLLAENTLDDCHSATIHTRTLQPAMDPEWLARYRPERHGAHSAMGNTLGAGEAEFWNRLTRKLPLLRHHEDAVYRHYFLFPNLYVATFFGAFVLLHRIDPLDPERAALDIKFCLPVSRPLTAGEAALHRAILRNLVEKALPVVAEDAEVCELAQKGQHFAPRSGILGTHEQRVGDFQHAVERVLAQKI